MNSPTKPDWDRWLGKVRSILAGMTLGYRKPLTQADRLTLSDMYRERKTPTVAAEEFVKQQLCNSEE